MKGPVITILSVLLLALCFLAYHNYHQKQTIDLLNKEVLRHSRSRYQLQVDKYKLEKQLDNCIKSDSLVKKPG